MQLATTPLYTRAVDRSMMLIEEFRKVSPEMTTQQAMTLLLVARYPGETITEIAKRAGLGLATVSRHVQVLGKERKVGLKTIGFGLLQDDYDDNDRRRKVLTLTAAGLRVIKSLDHLWS